MICLVILVMQAVRHVHKDLIKSVHGQKRRGGVPKHEPAPLDWYLPRVPVAGDSCSPRAFAPISDDKSFKESILDTVALRASDISAHR